MLLKFTVQNFLSIKDSQTLDLTAIKTYKERLNENTFSENGIQVLKSVVFYGANASGKSNLLRAMSCFLRIILTSAKESSSRESIPVSPFKFNERTQKEPTLFEIEFSISSTLYRYGFSVTKEKINKEWLFRRDMTQKREIPVFLRNTADRRNNNIEAPGFKGVDVDGISKKTRGNALFLSVCDAWAVEEAERIIKYFSSNIEIVFCENIASTRRTIIDTTEFLKDSNMKIRILDFLKNADLNIKDIKIKETEMEFPEELKAIIQEPSQKKLTRTEIASVHNIYDDMGNVIDDEILPFRFESRGTQKAYSLAGPIIDALMHGKTLLIDELDSKLHPIFTRRIVTLFNSAELNPRNAQLIFNTHDTNLLCHKTRDGEKRENLLRRDQIYFVEKDMKEATHFYSLIEFKSSDGYSIRKDASFEKDYLEGKYGAIPFIGDLFEFKKD